jgi:hypothetical protein
LLHEARPWGRFKADIIANQLKYRKISPVAIFEYESPNSYLHYPGSHIGKDIQHYFEFQDRIAAATQSENLQAYRDVDWYIISTLPSHSIQDRFWRYTSDLETNKDISCFRNNPLKCMLPKYRALYSRLESKCKRPAKDRNNLIFLNLSIEKGQPIIKPCTL